MEHLLELLNVRVSAKNFIHLYTSVSVCDGGDDSSLVNVCTAQHDKPVAASVAALVREQYCVGMFSKLHRHGTDGRTECNA